MTSRILPGIGLNGAWTQGDTWTVGGNENWLRASVLTQLSVESATVSLPASPPNGVMYLVPSGDAPANNIAARDNGAWVYLPPQEGWRAYVKDTGELLNFDGATWVSVLTPLAAANGGALLGYDVTDTQSIFDNALPLQDYTALRAYTERALGVKIKAPELAGFFWRDVSDTMSADNGGTVIVDGAGRRWKRIHAGVVLPEWFGDVSGANAAPALNAAFIAAEAAGEPVRLSGFYLVTETVNIPFNASIIAASNATIDGALMPATQTVPATVSIGGTGMTALPDLASAVVKGARQISFASAPSLQPGDWFLIFNPTAGSFNPARTYYYAGEACRASSVSGSDVVLNRGLFAGYSETAVDVYKPTVGKFSLSGELKVIATEASSNYDAIRLRQIVDSDISGLFGYAKTAARSIHVFSCFNLQGVNLTAIQQEYPVGGTTQYGIAFSNCQDIRLSGYFSASRHAVQHGGLDFAGAIPTRNVHTSGTISTTGITSAYAADAHGNCEYITVEGQIYGGVSSGGDHVRIKGELWPNSQGIAIYHNEMIGWTRDYSGLTIHAGAVNPADGSFSVIDFSSNNTGDSSATLGGFVDLRGMTVYAPNASRAFVIRTRETLATDIVVDLSGSKVLKFAADLAPGSPLSLVFVKAAGSAAFKRVILTDYYDDAGTAPAFSASPVLSVRGMKLTGITPFTTPSGAATADAAVTFAPAFPGIPNVVTTVTPVLISGTIPMTVGVAARSASGMTLRLCTTTGANFGAAATVNAMWTATYDT